jgi:hypothetical protein
MVAERTVPAPAQIVERRDMPQELNDTADRLVLEVVSAADDGYTAVPECQRLIAWLSAEFLPYVTGRFPQPPQDLRDLHDVLDALHGSNGPAAAQLALHARSLVFRLL